MAKSKNNTLENIIKSIPDISEHTLNWNGIDIKVKPFLSIEDSMKFAKIASETCFTSTGEYMPELISFGINIATIMVYTDLELPEDINDKYNLITFTDIVEKIGSYVDSSQYEKLIESVDERIDYKINTDIEYVRKQVDELYFSAQSLFGNISEAFSGIDPKVLNDMAKNISEHGIDESKLMESYLSVK